MISIKKFLAQDDTDSDRTLMHVVRILVQGIGEHAVAGDIEECARFRENILEISNALADEIRPEDLLVQAGSVLKGLEDHTRRAAGYQRVQTTELQNMVKMLTSTLGTISSSGKANVSVLSDIEKKVAVVSDLDDVRIMKARLADCLVDIRKEAQRQQLETEETIQELRRGLSRLRNDAVAVGAAVAQGRDPITGLPTRPEAEAALTESGRAGNRTYAAVMILDRLQILNARFGREAGDEILVSFTRMVQGNLKPEDRLFRWGGPAFLALLPRTTSIESIRGEVARAMENKLEHTIQTSSRNVLIPIAARWCVLPMLAAPRLIFQKIDDFAASPSVRV